MPRTIRNLAGGAGGRLQIYAQRDLQERVEAVARRYDVSISAVASLAVESGLKAVERQLAQQSHQQDA